MNIQIKFQQVINGKLLVDHVAWRNPLPVKGHYYEGEQVEGVIDQITWKLVGGEFVLIIMVEED